jgi:hypothetical protein
MKNRIMDGINLATGTQQFTPNQAHFINTNAVGRWATTAPTSNPAYLHRRHADGTVDTIGLHANENEYLELGGKGGTDIAAGRI